MTLGASNKKLPWVEKQKNPERNFKLRSMFLFVRPCTVGRKPWEYLYIVCVCVFAEVGLFQSIGKADFKSHVIKFMNISVLSGTFIKNYN